MNRQERIELQRRYMRGDLPLGPALIKKLKEAVRDRGPTDSSFYDALIEDVNNPASNGK